MIVKKLGLKSLFLIEIQVILLYMKFVLNLNKSFHNNDYIFTKIDNDSRI